MLVPDKPFLSILILQVRPEPTIVKHLSGAQLKARLLALPTNIVQGLKNLPGTNTLAYFENFVNYER